MDYEINIMDYKYDITVTYNLGKEDITTRHENCTLSDVEFFKEKYIESVGFLGGAVTDITLKVKV